MTTIVVITVGIVLAKVYVAFAYARHIEREHIPTEDSVVQDLNPRRGMSLAAAINLSRAIRRIH